eukprot:gene4814-875_t
MGHGAILFSCRIPCPYPSVCRSYSRYYSCFCSSALPASPGLSAKPPLRWAGAKGQTSEAGPDEDRAALELFYSAAGGEQWPDHRKWTSTAPVCRWDGVLCDSALRVSNLTLANQIVTGSGSAALHAISNMSALTDVNLTNRLAGDLTGTLPVSIGLMAAMVHLDLSWNLLEGPLPSSVRGMVSLETLILSHNNLGGALPPALGGMQALRTLALDHNGFTGWFKFLLYQVYVPSEMYLSSNNWSCPIFEASCSIIKDCNAVSNTGCKYAYEQDTALLDLYNQTQGTGGWNRTDMWGPLNTDPSVGPIGDYQICAWQGVSCAEVESALIGDVRVVDLELEDNGLTGQIPASADFWVKLPYLTTIIMHTNRLSGSLPGSLFRLPSLQVLLLLPLRLLHYFGFTKCYFVTATGSDPLGLFTVTLSSDSPDGLACPLPRPVNFPMWQDYKQVFCDAARRDASCTFACLAADQAEQEQFAVSCPATETQPEQTFSLISSCHVFPSPSETLPIVTEVAVPLVTLLLIALLILIVIWRLKVRASHKAKFELHGAEWLSMLLAKCLSYDPVSRCSAQETVEWLGSVQARVSEKKVQLNMQGTLLPQEAPKLPPVIGKVTLTDERIGHGAFGVVWRGIDPVTGMDDAVKQLSVSTAQQADEIQRELDLLKDLSNPHIIQYFGAHKSGNDVFVVMEYASGGTLLSLVKEFGSINFQMLQRILGDCLCGLEYLHNLRVVHRDIKPANLLRSGDGSFKIADFGCASVLSVHDPVTMSTKGTCLYMAPECAEGSSSFEVDVWALGITAVHAVTGEIPYSHLKKLDSTQILFYIMNTEEPYPIPSGIRQSLSQWISSCVLRRPKSRPTVKQLRRHWFFSDQVSAEQLKPKEPPPLPASFSGATDYQTRMSSASGFGSDEWN